MRWPVRFYALSLVLIIGCGGPDYGEPFLQSFRAAQRAYNAGRYERAADLYLEAAAKAQRIKDRDEAHFMRARMYVRLQRWADARAAYERLIKLSPQGPRTARAAFEHALILVDHGDASERETGWVELERAIGRYPNQPTADPGLTRWIEHAKEAGEDGVREHLRHWLARMGGTDLEQQLKYEMGLSFWRSHELSEAHSWLLRAAREHPYPRGNLYDDALWRASHVAEESGDYALAVADLNELLDVREVSDIGGSYERPRFPEAQMHLAELYRDRLKDPERARREFRRVWERHPTSILCDDAFWGAARLAQRAGDHQEACDLVNELHERYPVSRYNKCLREVCRSAPRGKRPCPPYIRDTLGL